MNLIQSKKIFLTLTVIAAVYSILAFAILPSESFFAGDEGVKFVQMKSLIRYDYRSLSLYYPGQNIDRDNRFFPIIPPYAVERAGKMYSQWPILFPFVSSLFFKVFGLRGLYMVPVFSSLLTLYVMSKICRLLFRKDSNLVLFLLAFATPFFFYSLVFWEHTLSVLLSTVVVYLVLISLDRHDHRSMLLAGVSLGLGIWVRNELYFLVLALLVSGFATRLMGKSKVTFLRVAYFFIGLFLVLVPMWIMQRMTIGEFWGADISQFTKRSVYTEISPFTTDISSFLIYKIKLAAVLLFHRFGSEWMIILALPYLFFALALIFPNLRKRELLLVLSLSGMAAVSVFTLSQNLLNSGLLVNAPFLIFSLVVLAASKKLEEGSSRVRFILLTGLVYVLLISVFAPATGGMQWGPRFMLPALPLLLVALGALGDAWQVLEFEGIMRKLAKGAFAVLVLVSLAVQIKGVQYLYHDRREDAKLVARVRERPERVIITDNFWFPQETAVIYEMKKFYFLGQRYDFRILEARLNRARIKSFAFVALSESDSSLSSFTSSFRSRERVKLPGSFSLESFRTR